MKNESMKRLEDRVTTDLGQTEEAVFEVIALNPDATAAEIKDKYNMRSSRVLEVTDSLVEKGFVEPVEGSELQDCVWRVTELGRLQLLKFVEVMRFDVMEAKLRGQPQGQVEKLEEKKRMFENAYRQCKALFEEGGEL